MSRLVRILAIFFRIRISEITSFTYFLYYNTIPKKMQHGKRKNTKNFKYFQIGYFASNPHRGGFLDFKFFIKFLRPKEKALTYLSKFDIIKQTKRIQVSRITCPKSRF